MRFSCEFTSSASGAAAADLTFSCWFVDEKGTKHELVPPEPSRKHRARQRFLVRKEQLAHFYRQHCPEKEAQAADVLAKYQFKDVVAACRKQYGTVPPAWETEAEQLRSLYRKHNPEKVSLSGVGA